jgi:putative peptide zinc metalloprotease protein
MSLEEAGGRTFSDAWHRVAGVRARLRTSVIAHRQHFRGEPWVVLRDQFSHEWFRVTPDAWTFLCRLGDGLTIDEAWNRSLAVDAARALTQEEVVQLLGQLNLANLLHYDRADSQASQFERFQKRKSRQLKTLLMGFLSIKIPLFDPDRWLDRALPVIHAICSRWGLGLYLLLLLAGLKAVVDESDRLFDQSSHLLAPSNLVLLYLGFLLSKTLHEFSHAAACKWLGGEVHKVGVMLLFFAPIPFMDATSAWGFRSRRDRVLVGISGVAAELGMAAVAALVWTMTAPGTLNSLAYDIMFVASVSTAVFNLNPLLRFDGYHILVDLLEVPNLFQRSRDQLRYLAERYVLRLHDAQPAARTRTEVFLLPLYGISSLVYWVLLMVTIVVFIAGEYLDLGVALALLLIFTSAIMPMFKFVKYLYNDPRLGFRRGQAVAISSSLSLLLLCFLALIPLPDRVRVTGVLEAVQSRQLYTETEGLFAELLIRPGSRVEAGQPLLRLHHPELDYDIRAAQMQREQLEAQRIQAVSRASTDLSAIEQQLTAVLQHLTELNRRREAQLVVAPIAGEWSASELDGIRGQWLTRGASVGTIVNPQQWRFVAVLPQVGSHVVGEAIERSEVRLRGQEGINVHVTSTSVMPFEQGLLPSRALGMAGGGELAVSPSDPNGVVAAEPFFRIESRLMPDGTDLPALVHGRIGVMRLTLPSRPLLVQWERRLRQFLQRRFRV